MRTRVSVGAAAGGTCFFRLSLSLSASINWRLLITRSCDRFGRGRGGTRRSGLRLSLEGRCVENSPLHLGSSSGGVERGGLGGDKSSSPLVTRRRGKEHTRRSGRRISSGSTTSPISPVCPRSTSPVSSVCSRSTSPISPVLVNVCHVRITRRVRRRRRVG